MPVRKVAQRGGNVIGKFPSLKLQRMIAFESLLERDFIYLLDYDPTVAWFEEQPLTLEYPHEGQVHRYTPDFHLVESGQHVLVECKPAHFVATTANQRKFAVAAAWCQACDWQFHVVTDEQVRRGYRLHNIKLLTAYARLRLDPGLRDALCIALQDLPAPVPIQELARTLDPTDPATVTAALLHLAYHGAADLPLDDEPITPSTHIGRGEPDARGGCPMTRMRLITGARVQWQGAAYQIVRLLPGGQAQLEDLLTGAVVVAEVAALVTALFAAELAFIPPGRPATATPAAEDTAARSLADYPADLVAIARYRLAVIAPLLTRTPRTRADVLARVQELAADPVAGARSTRCTTH